MDRYCANCIFGAPVDYGWRGKFHCWLCNLIIKNPFTGMSKLVGMLGWKGYKILENYDHVV